MPTAHPQIHAPHSPATIAATADHRLQAHTAHWESSANPAIQRIATYAQIANSPAPIQRQAAPQGGLPANLKSGIEGLSGIAMDDVRVHYNSSKPAQLQAHAYAQGTDIHIAPGQERHLPHEAWHVVQQKQGRVKPTLQLKGVAINDDSALEREADVMGGRAVGGGWHGQIEPNVNQQRTSMQGLPVQRVIHIAREDYDKKNAYDLVSARGNLQGKTPAFAKETVLPAWDTQEMKFTDESNFLESFGEVVGFVSRISEVSERKSISEIVDIQRKEQSSLRDNQHQDRYRGVFTTFGFEHEFADMTENSPLSGVSHLELAESTEEMPWTGLKFILETDASNELELVSPPFLIPTVDGLALPSAEVVGEIDQLMQKRLNAIVEKDMLPWYKCACISSPEDRYASLEQLLEFISTEVGITLKLNEVIKLQPAHLSHRTNLDKLRNILLPDESPDSEVVSSGHHGTASNLGNLQEIVLDPMDDEKKTPAQEHLRIQVPEIPKGPSRRIDVNALGGIKVRPSQKWGQEPNKVFSQGNFATDLDITQAMLEMESKYDNSIVNTFSYLQEKLSKYIPQSDDPHVNQFRAIAIPKFASMFSLHSQKILTEVQSFWFQQLQDPNHEDKEIAAHVDHFVAHGLISSFVKDGNPVWVKDHLQSIAIGTFDNKEKASKAAWILLQGQQATASNRSELLEACRTYLQGTLNKYTRSDRFSSHLNSFYDDLLSTMGSTIKWLEAFDTQQEFKLNKVPLYGHNPDMVGGRQDTLIDPDRVQMPNIWADRRLHVSEIRREKPDTFLANVREKMKPQAPQS